MKLAAAAAVLLTHVALADAQTIEVMPLAGYRFGGDFFEIPPLDLLRALGLPDTYVVSREGSAQPFASQEEIYDQVPDGSKLRCVPQAVVGADTSLDRKALP